MTTRPDVLGRRWAAACTRLDDHIETLVYRGLLRREPDGTTSLTAEQTGRIRALLAPVLRPEEL